MNDTIQTMQRKAHAAIDNAAHLTHDAYDKVEKKAKDIKHTAECGYDCMTSYMSKKPLMILAIAALAGGLIALCCQSKR